MGTEALCGGKGKANPLVLTNFSLCSTCTKSVLSEFAGHTGTGEILALLESLMTMLLHTGGGGMWSGGARFKLP